MEIYQIATQNGMRVQFQIHSGQYHAAVSLRGDDTIYTGSGITLDAAIIDAIERMDEVNNAQDRT
jgi:hypothetical protein